MASKSQPANEEGNGRPNLSIAPPSPEKVERAPSSPGPAAALVRQITNNSMLSPKARAREERLKKFHDLHGASAASLRRQAELIALTVKRPSGWVLHPEKTRSLVYWDVFTSTALICARSSSSRIQQTCSSCC